MTERLYSDPVLELARRLGDGDDPVNSYELASEMTDEDAETVLEVLDEVEAEQEAAGIVSRLRQMGYTL